MVSLYTTPEVLVFNKDSMTEWSVPVRNVDQTSKFSFKDACNSMSTYYPCHCASYGSVATKD